MEAIVNQPSVHGFTALLFAARGSDYEESRWRTRMVETLIQFGARLNAEGPAGERPLHMAARWGDLSICTKLIIAKADVMAITVGGDTPLHIACDAAHELCEASKVIGQEGPPGLSPLVVVAHSHHETCLSLMKFKAEPKAQDEHQWTPMLLTARSGNEELWDLLLKMSCSHSLGWDHLLHTTDGDWNVLHLCVLAYRKSQDGKRPLELAKAARTLTKSKHKGKARLDKQEAQVHQIRLGSVQSTLMDAHTLALACGFHEKAAAEEDGIIEALKVSKSRRQVASVLNVT